MAEDRSEIVFFDVETTIPIRSGQGFTILEFGAILVCPRKLVELHSYSTLVRPTDLSIISSKSERCNGISRHAVSTAPSFSDIADKVFDILQGRIWAGHNILRFDCPRIREAFARIGKPAPEPKGTIDSLALLTERFGRRAGNMKMATLATYFGLGQQTHRSLDDVRMNLEVLKYCATVLFLESSLPDILVSDTPVSLSTNRRTYSSKRALPVDMSETPNSTSTPGHPINQTLGARILDFVEPARSETNSFNMKELSEELMASSIKLENAMEEQSLPASPDIPHQLITSETCSSSSTFLTPEDISISSIKASWIPSYYGRQRIQVLHKDVVLKLLCTHLKVRFGLSTKFVDKAGRPKLSFVVDAPPGLCQVLEACDNLVKNSFTESSTTSTLFNNAPPGLCQVLDLCDNHVRNSVTSDWRPVITRKDGYWNFPTVRLHIPTVVSEEVPKYSTEVFEKEADSDVERKLDFSTSDAAQLISLLAPGTCIDAYLSLDPYDYQQNAGIRLVAEKLVFHSK